MYETIPSIKEKDDFVLGLTRSIMDPNFELRTVEDVKIFLHPFDLVLLILHNLGDLQTI